MCGLQLRESLARACVAGATKQNVQMLQLSWNRSTHKVECALGHRLQSCIHQLAFNYTGTPKPTRPAPEKLLH